MSKKIKISIPNKIRPNLVELFHTYIIRKGKERKVIRKGSYYDDSYSHWDEFFQGWYDDYDDYDDDCELMYPRNCIPLYNKAKHSSSHVQGNKIQNLFSGMEDLCSGRKNGKRNRGKNKKKFKLEDVYDDSRYGEYVDVTKEIWFYPDYHDKEDRLEFNSLSEFSDYCESEGYYVSTQVEQDLLWRYESHCCIKHDKSSSILEVIGERSYGDMFYEACDANELSETYTVI